MVMPLIGLFLRSPEQPSQTGLGPLSDLRISTTLPVRLPLAASLISTMDFTSPVLSSMVFQRPTAPSAAIALDAAPAQHGQGQHQDRLVHRSPPRDVVLRPYTVLRRVVGDDEYRLERLFTLSVVILPSARQRLFGAIRPTRRQ